MLLPCWDMQMIGYICIWSSQIGFYTVRTRWWAIRDFLFENIFPHKSQTNGFSSGWTQRWQFKCCFCEKAFLQCHKQMVSLQCGHADGWSGYLFEKRLFYKCHKQNGFSPVWTRRWVLRLSVREKAFLQMSQTKWFLSSVDTSSSAQAIRTRKSFFTNVTNKYVLSSVDTLMGY